jgi:hypothetical protein
MSSVFFPYEIFRLISLHLPLNSLAVSRNLAQMYNESWFRDKLRLLCRDHLWTKHFTFEELYKRYLLACHFHREMFYTKVARFKGIKVWSSYEITYHMLTLNLNQFNLGSGYKIAGLGVDTGALVLTFNGELFHYQSNVKPQLVSAHVVDMDSHTYVTYDDTDKYTWYYYSNHHGSIKINSFVDFRNVVWTSKELIYSSGTYITILSVGDIVKLLSNEIIKLDNVRCLCQKIVNNTFGASYLSGSEVIIGMDPFSKDSRRHSPSKKALDIYPNIILEEQGAAIYDYHYISTAISPINQLKVKSSVNYLKNAIVLTDNAIVLYMLDYSRGIREYERYHRPQNLVNIFGNDHGLYYGTKS